MKRALVVIDVQNDFLPGGALAVPDGDVVIEVANLLLRDGRFDLRVATQDFHPPEHASFAASHAGKRPYESVVLSGRPRRLLPPHCVQGTRGADFPDGLEVARFDAIFPKGTDVAIDGYSGFFDEDRRKNTGLHDHLVENGIHSLVLLGLATDTSVKATALDALSLGYRVAIAMDGCRGVELNEGDEKRALARLEREGALLALAAELLR